MTKAEKAQKPAGRIFAPKCEAKGAKRGNAAQNASRKPSKEASTETVYQLVPSK